MKWRTYPIAILLVWSTSAHCQVLSEVTALNSAASGGEALSTSIGRQKLASAAVRYCKLIERDFPTNSPSERAWLAAEFGGNSERMLRAASSAEFARMRAAQFVETCLSFGSMAESHPDSSKNFAGLAYAFVRFLGDAEWSARKNNLDPKKYAFSLLRSFSEWMLIAAVESPS